MVEGEARTYFAGDTGLFDDMAEAVGPVDVALLPVGGWGPYLGHGHLDAGRAAQALTRLAPRSAVPVHYGTYWPIGMDGVRPHEFHSPGDEFVRKAALLAPEVSVHRLSHGEHAAGGRQVIHQVVGQLPRSRRSRRSAIRRCSCWWHWGRWCRWCRRARW